jgi:hypothetical protein
MPLRPKSPVLVFTIKNYIWRHEMINAEYTWKSNEARISVQSSLYHT